MKAYVFLEGKVRGPECYINPYDPIIPGNLVKLHHSDSDGNVAIHNISEPSDCRCRYRNTRIDMTKPIQKP